ncbi:MAG TPA: hypothetical protein VLB44_03835 [Kofleriaceae bacterium]|nr:hypothetical protein [Kofleriaceae bacterium]
MHKHVLIAALMLGACGGDDSSSSSGVDSTKQVKDLTPAERATECQWGIALEGGAGHTTTCPDNVTVTVDTQAQCEAGLATIAGSTTCTLTVAQMEACTEASATDPCTALSSQACAPVLACLQ